ncbi:MAG: hypothetical protein KBD83_00445 [Gammaproteobacteria bacterium]|nr:hypothetical protein [Gammaproteobacteria bacterium]
MGSESSKSKTRNAGEKKNLKKVEKTQFILVPAPMYNYFRDPNSDPETVIPIGLKKDDFINLMISYAERTETKVPNADEIYAAAVVILRDKFKIPVTETMTDTRIQETTFVVPRSFVLNEITTLSKEDNNDFYAHEEDTKSETGSVKSNASSLISAQSDSCRSIRTVSSTGSVSLKQQGKPKRPSAHKPQKSPQDKVNDTLPPIVSQCRIVALDNLKLILSEQSHFDSCFPESIERTSAFACVFALINALLEDVIFGDQSTLEIIRSVSEEHLSDRSRFLNYFSELLTNSSDERPTHSDLDLLKFLSRFSIALKSKQAYYFNAFFDDSIQIPKTVRKLGETFEHKCIEMLKSLFETFMSPQCNAAIYILRHTKELPENLARDENGRFHLIAQLIYRVSVLKEKTMDILRSHPSQALSEHISEKLQQPPHSHLNDELTPISNQELMEFLFCIAYMLNELPRQILKTDSPPNVLARISQTKDNIGICKALQKEARRLEAELKSTPLEIIAEGSRETSPARKPRNTDRNETDNTQRSILAASLSTALGNLSSRESSKNNTTGAILNAALG